MARLIPKDQKISNSNLDELLAKKKKLQDKFDDPETSFIEKALISGDILKVNTKIAKAKATKLY